MQFVFFFFFFLVHSKRKENQNTLVKSSDFCESFEKLKSVC